MELNEQQKAYLESIRKNKKNDDLNDAQRQYLETVRQSKQEAPAQEIPDFHDAGPVGEGAKAFAHDLVPFGLLKRAQAVGRTGASHIPGLGPERSYTENLGDIENELGRAKEKYPTATSVGEGASTLAGLAIPGLQFEKMGKLLSKIPYGQAVAKKAAVPAYGFAEGYGRANVDEDAVERGFLGAGTGALISGVAAAPGKAKDFLTKKYIPSVSDTLTEMPKSMRDNILKDYAKDKEGFLNQPGMGVVQDFKFKPGVEKVENDLTRLDKESWDIVNDLEIPALKGARKYRRLEKMIEPKAWTTDPLRKSEQEYMGQKAQEIEKDVENEVTKKWMAELSKEDTNKIIKDHDILQKMPKKEAVKLVQDQWLSALTARDRRKMANEITIPGGRAKQEVKDLQSGVKWDKKTGVYEKLPISDKMGKKASQELNSIIKKQSTPYKAKMLELSTLTAAKENLIGKKGVVKDADKFADTMRQAFHNYMRNGVPSKEIKAVRAYDKATKGDLEKALELSYFSERVRSHNTRGSKGTNTFANAGGAIGDLASAATGLPYLSSLGKAGGSWFGNMRDKYGTKWALDLELAAKLIEDASLAPEKARPLWRKIVDQANNKVPQAMITKEVIQTIAPNTYNKLENEE